MEKDVKNDITNFLKTPFEDKNLIKHNGVVKVNLKELDNIILDKELLKFLKKDKFDKRWNFFKNNIVVEKYNNSEITLIDFSALLNEIIKYYIRLTKKTKKTI